MDKVTATASLVLKGWLSSVEAALRVEIVTRCDLLEFAAGAPIYHAGDDTGGLYGVVAGGVKLYLLSPDGDAGLGYVGGQGFWTGDAAALTGRPRRISLIAGTACWLLRLPRSAIADIAEKHPIIWKHMAGLVARNLMLAMDLVDALKRDEPTKRVAAILITLTNDNGDEATVLGLSQTELGELANASRASVNNSLGVLESLGLIKRGYASLTISNRSSLMKFVHGHHLGD